MSERELTNLIQELRRLTVIQENNNRVIVARQADIIRRIEEVGQTLDPPPAEAPNSRRVPSRQPRVGDRVALLKSGGIGREGEVGSVTKVTRSRVSVRLDNSGRIAVRANRNVAIIGLIPEDDGH